MLVHRINPEAGDGNASGPIDEVYLLQTQWYLHKNNGSLNSAPYNLIYDHTQINDETNPEPFLYNDGNGG